MSSKVHESIARVFIIANNSIYSFNLYRKIILTALKQLLLWT